VDVRYTKQSLFYAAMVKHLAKVSVAGDVLPAVSYPSRRPKGGAAEKLDYVEVVHVRNRRQHYQRMKLDCRFGCSKRSPVEQQWWSNWES